MVKACRQRLALLLASVLSLVLVRSYAYATNTRRLRRDLAMSLPEFPWHEFQDSMSMSLPVGDISMTEFPWHEPQNSMSMSLSDSDISMSGEEAYIWDWDAFVTDEPTLDPINKPNEELLITTNSKPPTTASYTSSPSTGPIQTSSTATIIEHSALVQYEMQTMARAMNEYEIFAIFQPSCSQFLNREFKYEEKQVSNIDCKVTNQQLLGAVDSTTRRLEATSLVVDVKITGDAASDVQLDDMISEAFIAKGELFVNSLKVKGQTAEIATFDKLYSLTSFEQTNEKSALSSGSDVIEDRESSAGSFVVIITGVGLVVVLIAGFAVSRSRKETIHVVEDQTLVSAGPPQNIVASPKMNGAFDFNCGFLNSLGQESYLPSALMPSEVVPRVVPRVRREVVAPRGKLGIVTEDSATGVIIHSVKDESPLEGLLFPGDLIEALDSMDISHLSSSSLTKLMVSRSNHERKITVLSERLNTNNLD